MKRKRKWGLEKGKLKSKRKRKKKDKRHKDLNVDIKAANHGNDDDDDDGTQITPVRKGRLRWMVAVLEILTIYSVMIRMRIVMRMRKIMDLS